jgi:hypothetical protein
MLQTGDRTLTRIMLCTIQNRGEGRLIDIRRTWANQSFDSNDGKPAGQVVEGPLVNGTLRTYASEVVLITFS